MKTMRCILSFLLVILMLSGCGGNPAQSSGASAGSDTLTEEQLRDIVLSMPDIAYAHVEKQAKEENITMVAWIRKQAEKNNKSVEAYLRALYKELGIDQDPVKPSTTPSTAPTENHDTDSWILTVASYSGTHRYMFYYEEGVLVRYVFVYKENSQADAEVTEYKGDALKDAPLGNMTSEEIIKKLQDESCDYYNWQAIS